MKLSNNIANIKTYYFAKKLAEVRILNESGKGIINLGIGSPDIATPNAVVDSLKAAISKEGASQYQSYSGIPELRKGFANWYKEIYDVDLNPDTEILPLMGSKEAIMHIHLAFCNPGDTVLIPNPGYPTYASSAKMLWLNVVYYNLKEDNDWLPSIAELEKLALLNCKVMWINYPNMPTGAVAERACLTRLIEFAKQKEMLLVNDNPYSLILNSKPISIHSCSTDYNDVLELNSLSKSHNMSGWRVGVVSGSEENIRHLLKVKSNFDSGMYKPIQIAAVEALKMGNEWFDELNQEYNERAAIIYEIIEQLGCTHNENHKGMFVWAKVNPSQRSGEELSDYLLYNHDVFATPGSVFGTNGDQYIRFSLCVEQNQLKEVLNRVKNIRV